MKEKLIAEPSTNNELALCNGSPESIALNKILTALDCQDININSRGLFEQYIRQANSIALDKVLSKVNEARSYLMMHPSDKPRCNSILLQITQGKFTEQALSNAGKSSDTMLEDIRMLRSELEKIKETANYLNNDDKSALVKECNMNKIWNIANNTLIKTTKYERE